MDNYREKSKDAPETATGEIIGKGALGKVILYPFGPYEVLIKLLNSGEFVEILEIRINKDFRDFKQKTQSRGYHDVSDIYEQE